MTNDGLPGEVDNLLERINHDELEDLCGMLKDLRYGAEEDDSSVIEFFAADKDAFRVSTPFLNAKLAGSFTPQFRWQPKSPYAVYEVDAQSVGERLTPQIRSVWFSRAEAEGLDLRPIRYGAWLSSFQTRPLGGPPDVERSVNYDAEHGRVTYLFQRGEMELLYEIDLAVSERPTVERVIDELVPALHEAFGAGETWFPLPNADC